MSETKQELELEVTPLERPQEEWVGRLQYEKSFLAKLALADDNVRNYYAILATRYLSYDKVKSRTGWAGVSFSHRRNKLAMITINGKTLCLYLAIDPETITEGKFRTKDTSALKKYEDTPVLLKIKSGGALRYALKLIEEQTRKQDIEYKKNLPAPITAKSLPKDTFDNLVASGMIRMIRGRSPHTAACVAAEEGDSSSDGDADGERGVNDKLNRNVVNQSAGKSAQSESAAASDEETASAPEYTPEAVGETEAIAEESTTEAAEETAKREESAAEAGGGIAPSVFPYKEILELLLGGETAIKATKKYVLRSVDEMWVKAAEECLPALDTLTRNPTGFIAETEEILPIEMTKKITGRSIQHLGRHADYLSETDDGELMPTKMLNIFREDSLQTYENKFLNTLLSRLYIFVHRRAEAARKRRAEEEVYSLDLADTFRDGDLRCKVSLNIEISRKCNENAVRKAEIEASLEERIEKLDSVFSAYMTSPFVQKMGASYIHPPISRTNAILKNKYFRQCLALWEFIESYDDSEHGVFFAAEEKELSDECLKETYESAARQYVAFKNAMAQAFEETEEAEEEAEEETDSFAEEAAVSEGEESTAGEAEENGETESEEAGEVEIRGGKRYRKTFLANLILSDEQTKENFAAIANAFLKYDRVKMRIGKYGCVFSRGRERLARAEVRGKTVKLYLALNAAEEEEKYRLRDVSAIRKNEKTPALLRVRSSRSVKYAEILADKIAEKRGIPLAKKPTAIVSAADYPYRTREELIEEGLILVSGEGEQAHFTAKELAEKIGEHIRERMRSFPAKFRKNAAQSAASSAEEAEEETDSFAEETAVSEGVETAAGETEESGETESEEAGEEEIRGGKRYRKTFLANLILSDEQTKENFAAIANAFLKYDRVKMRIGKYGCVFSRGRERLARAEVRGKTVKLYLALNAAEEEEKYRLRDVSAIRKNEKTPALLRVRSSRSVKYAEILADKIAEKRGIPLAKKPTAIVSAADYPYRTREELIEEGLILVSGEGEPVRFPVHAFAGRIGERISQNLRELEKHFSDVPVKGMKNGEEEAEKSIEEAAKEVRAAEEFRAAEAETEDEAAIAREAEEIKLDEENKRAEEEARQKDFPQIRFRVSNDYSNPAQAGLDDTKSFLKDEAVQAAEAKAAEEKKTESFGGFFRRLFFSRKKRAEREKKAKKGKRN